MIGRAIMKAQKFLYVKEFRGLPNLTNFQLVEEELPVIKDGEFLVAAKYLSVDPYMRSYMLNFQPPVAMVGGQVAE